MSGADEEMRVEIDPETVFGQFTDVVNDVRELCFDVFIFAGAKFSVAKTPRNEEVVMGVCCQRNTFISWDKSVTDCPLGISGELWSHVINW